MCQHKVSRSGSAYEREDVKHAAASSPVGSSGRGPDSSVEGDPGTTHTAQFVAGGGGDWIPGF